MKLLSLEDFAKRIDHTNLKPFADERDIITTIEEAKKYNFRGVCIPLIYVPLARRLLKGSDVKVVTVIGFPLGYYPTEVKVREAKLAAEWGADEIDMVMNVSLFKSGKREYVVNDIRSVIESSGLPIKVIIETSYLTEEEIKDASILVADSGAFCVKTNTGFGARGVTIEDIRIIRNAIRGKIRIKASGGIKTAEKAIALIREGADIIGASAGVKLYEEYRRMLEKKL